MSSEHIMLVISAETITDDQIVELVKHKLAIEPRVSRIEWLGMGDEAMSECAPYKSYCRRRCAEAWNEIYGLDLDAVKELWLARQIDAGTYDDAMIDVTTRHDVARRWAALSRCAAALARGAAS